MNEWETEAEAEGDVSGRTFSSQDHLLVYTFQNTVFIHNYHIFQEFPRYYDNDMLLTIIDYRMRKCFCSRRVEVEEPVEALVPVLVEVEAVAASRLRGKHWRCGAAPGHLGTTWNGWNETRHTMEQGVGVTYYVLLCSMCIYVYLFVDILKIHVIRLYAGMCKEWSRTPLWKSKFAQKISACCS